MFAYFKGQLNCLNAKGFCKKSNLFFFIWFKRFLDQGPEQREPNLTVLCLLIIIILISYIIIYYILIKLLIVENCLCQNQKRNCLILILLIFSTILKNWHLWQPSIVNILHWCLICTVPLKSVHQGKKWNFAA